MSWEEPKKKILTHKGWRNVAPGHYEVSHKKKLKKDMENTLIQPLVAVDGTVGVKTVEKALIPRNPIDEIKNIRHRYQGGYAIIRETMQNSERAGRSNRVPVDIEITITPEMYKISDTAGGMNKQSIDTVFNLGQSGWALDSDTNPFGQGFMSFILLFNKAEVVSNDVNAEFDWGKIEEEYNRGMDFDLTKAYRAQEAESPDAFGAKGKFTAIFTNPVSGYDYSKAIEQAKVYARTLPVRLITINGEIANNKINFSDIPPGYVRVEKPYKPLGDKLGIEGYFAPSTQDDAIRLYFQGLPVGPATSDAVDNSFWGLQSITGDVNINTTFYGRPSENRDSWVRDDAIRKTEDLIKGLARNKAIDMIKYSSQSDIEKFQGFITRYTTFDDIKYRVRFEVIEPEVVDQITKVERELHKELTEVQFKSHMTDIFGTQSALNEAVERAKSYSGHVDAKEYNRRQEEYLDKKQELIEQQHKERDEKQSSYIEVRKEVVEQKKEDLEENRAEQKKAQVKTEQKIKEFFETREDGGYTAAKWKKETFWAKRSDAILYMEDIQMAGYYSIPVVFAENKFQEEVFQNFENFHHISDLEASVTLSPHLSSPGARNAQERRIEYIIRVFLDASGFNDIKLIIANINAKKVMQVAQSKNRIEEPITLLAYAEPATSTIYLQRTLSYGTADGYNDFHGIKSLYPYFKFNDFPQDNKSIGQGDMAVFSKIRKVLAHEIAHIKHHTKDDTVDHFKAIVAIDSAFDSAIAGLKASSKISESTTGIGGKVRERLGLKEGDSVVVTYTRGSSDKLEGQEKPAIQRLKNKNIYVSEHGSFYTYKELQGIEGDTLSQLIAEGKYKFTGYSIGDRVLFNALRYGTDEKEGTVEGIDKEDYRKNIRVRKDYDDSVSAYPLMRIIKKLERQAPKYDNKEIFVGEYDHAMTYEQIKKHGSGDLPIENGRYKPTGLFIGDRVATYDGREGVIKTVDGSLQIQLDTDSQIWLGTTQIKKIEDPSDQLSFESFT